jgi:hypothetical protein
MFSRAVSSVCTGTCFLPFQQLTHNRFHRAFRGGRAAGDTDYAVIGTPFGLHLFGLQQKISRHSLFPRHFAQTVGVTAGAAADNQYQVAPLCQLPHRVLAIGGGIADIFLWRRLEMRKTPFQHRHDALHLVNAQGGLGGNRQFALRHLHTLRILHRLHQCDLPGRVSHGALGFHVSRVSDVDDVVPLCGEPLNLAMHFRDKRAGCINDPQVACSCILTNLGRYPVRTEHHRRARWYLGNVLDKEHAPLLERAHHVFVMHNGMAHVYRSAIRLYCQVQHLYGVRHPCAETTR